MPKYGVALLHYNRHKYLKEIAEAIQHTIPPGTRFVVCDDGSEDPVEPYLPNGVILIRGSNLGVSANRNRALWALQDCDYLFLVEDDLKPIKAGWVETYAQAAELSGIHHFTRVQDKEIAETIPSFSAFLASKNLHPVFGPSPRGDLVMLTSTVVRCVGGYNPMFRGAGYAHGEYSKRIAKAGLIGHPASWIDIREARDAFVQVGDREGGRWKLDEKEIKRQLSRNKQVLKQLQKKDYVYHPLTLE